MTATELLIFSLHILSIAFRFFGDFQIIFSMIGGALSFILAERIKSYIALNNARRQTEISELNEILEDGNLVDIGSYLKEKFGSVPAFSYATNNEIRERVNLIISRVSKIAEPPAPEEGPTTQHNPATDVPNFVPLEIKNFLTLVWEEIKNGKNWNGLFLLRRDLEKRIREQAGYNDNFRSLSISQIINSFNQPPTAEQFRNFYRIASAAVHGDSVSDDATLQAFNAAKEVYIALSKPNAIKRRAGDATSSISS